jgi:hypothetical protein
MLGQDITDYVRLIQFNSGSDMLFHGRSYYVMLG